ncbi:MAG: hypothetical protein WCI74_12575 [Actinomycetes bacterium]
MQKMITVVPLVAALALSAAGCSSSSSSGSSPTPTAASSTSQDHSQILTTYFNAYGTRNPTTMAAMLSSAAKDSPAYVFGQHQINTSLAYLSDNIDPIPLTVTVAGDTVTTVDELPADATANERAAATSVYRDFQFSPEGLIQTWTTVPGGPLAPRIAAQSATATKSAVTVSLKTSYQTPAGGLFLTYDVSNGSTTGTSVAVVGYVNPDGRQVSSDNTPPKLSPHPAAFTTGRSHISNGIRGGQLIVQFADRSTAKLAVS